MDNERFILILLISLLIIKIFCKDTLEGQTDQEPDDVETPQAVRLNTGSCENPITTNEECIAAATALGLDPPMWDSSPGLTTNYPNGCSIPYGTKAYFNTRTGQGVECGGGSAEADCICASPNVASQVDTPEEDISPFVNTLNIVKEEFSDTEPIRCSSKDYNALDRLNKCLENENDEEFNNCDGAKDIDISDECMGSCVVPVMARNLMDRDTSTNELMIETLNDIDFLRTTYQDTVSECLPTEKGEIFGVDCLRNCKDYFHECEYKEEIKREDGKTTFEKTYGNIEECPHGELPDQTCEDVEWGCKECEDGYYVGSDNLCKPVGSMWPSVISCLIFIACICLIVFLWIKFGAYILKTGTKAISQGINEGKEAVKSK